MMWSVEKINWINVMFLSWVISQKMKTMITSNIGHHGESVNRCEFSPSAASSLLSHYSEVMLWCYVKSHNAEDNIDNNNKYSDIKDCRQSMELLRRQPGAGRVPRFCLSRIKIFAECPHTSPLWCPCWWLSAVDGKIMGTSLKRTSVFPSVLLIH